LVLLPKIYFFGSTGLFSFVWGGGGGEFEINCARTARLRSALNQHFRPLFSRDPVCA
jgi:hypothetical protein